MAQIRHFRASNGSVTIPVTGGTQTFTLYDLSRDLKEHHFFIAFVDDDGNLETPTAGTVTVTASPSTSPVVFDGIENGSFSAADVYSASRVRPVASGPLTVARLVVDGVTGATNVVASITGY